MYIKMINKDKGVVFDLQHGIVEYKLIGNKIVQSKLGKKDRDVLMYLINNMGRLISKEEILHAVWANRIVCENTVSVSLSNIRKFIKKADEECSCLTNISGLGYVFNPVKSGFKLEQTKCIKELAF